MPKKLPHGLRLRGNTWYMQCMIDGKRYNRSLKLPKECRAEAVQVAREFWLSVARGEIGIQKKDPLIESLFENFIAFKRSEVTPKHLEVVEGYLQIGRAHV